MLDQESRAAKQVIVVTSEKAHADRDQAALKKHPLQVGGVFASGKKALAHLQETGADVILCDTSMTDMEARSFLKEMKAKPALKNIPVIMITLNNDRNTVLDAVSGGCSGYILRPYSDETFSKHINTAMQLARFNELESRQIQDAKLMMETGEYDEAIEEFEEVISSSDEAQKYYDLGCKYLVKEKYGKAIVAFHKAVKINDVFAEAYQGLAEAYKRKGDLQQCQQNLKRAAVLFAQFEQMEKVKEIFIDILKYDNNAPNPFNTLGVRLRKSGDVQGAIRAYKQALELTPNDENIYFNMAKAYVFLNENKNALEYAAMALRMNPNFTEARKVYKSLKGKSWPQATQDLDGRKTGEPGAMMDV